MLQGICIACASSEIGLHFSQYCSSDLNVTSGYRQCPATTPLGIGYWPAPVITISMILIKCGSTDKMCPFIGLISMVNVVYTICSDTYIEYA